MLLAAALLVSVPVFAQAPLVRLCPWLSLVLTVPWLWVSLRLRGNPRYADWGDLLVGFTWTWLAGSIYWGWFRWEPVVHLPIEAIGLPFVCLALNRSSPATPPQEHRQPWKVGHWFYLGSLLGTALTDFYFYLVDLMPHWRQLMRIDPQFSQVVFQDALSRMHTPWGGFCAGTLLAMLLVLGGLSLRSRQLHFWAFGGAVLSTILVDGLFWFAATLA